MSGGGLSRRAWLLGAGAAVVPPFYVTLPKPMPGLAFSDGAGRAVDLAGFRGKVVLLNIWATWCVPCRKEMPSLDRVQARLGGARFEVVALSIDTGGQPAVRKFYAAEGIRHLGVFLDPSGSAMEILRLEGVPTSFLIDAEGRQIGRETGPVEWDDPAVMGFLRRRIGG